ncbi:MAG: HlyD family secretion protein [Acidobacteriaceae bacterium]|nr:HlyD family secretion protein [Acidobacteriaceae bacterium]
MADDTSQQRNAQAPQAQADEQHDSEARRRPVNPRRKRTVRFVLLAILVVAIIAAIPIYAYYTARESTDDAQVDGHLIPISPRVSGTIVSVLVNDNEPVKAGQELVRLDPADFQVTVQQAEAAVATAEANTSESSANVPLTNINTRSQVSTSFSEVEQNAAAVNSAQKAADAARARLDASKAALTQAQANYQKAQKDLVRYRDLVEKDEISKQDYDAAQAAADAGAAQVESAKADIMAAQHTLDQANAEVQQSRAKLATAEIQRRQSQEVRPRQTQVSEARYKQALAQVKQSQANLDQAKLNLGYTHVVAPVDGVVSRKTAEPGMQVTAGQQLMSLIPLDDVWVTANYKETQLRNMHTGQHVSIKVDTFGSSREYRGHIDSIAGASGAKFSLLPPENATGNYVKVVQRIPVKIVLEVGENRDHRLLPGMSVEPTVLLDSGKGQNQWQ